MCRSVGDSIVTKATKEKQSRRHVSAIKTILLVSGTFFLIYLPLVVIRLVVYGAVSTLDLETRRYPALTLFVRCSVLVMSTATPVVNPILYVSNRKRIRASMFELLPWLRAVVRIRAPKVNVADIGS